MTEELQIVADILKGVTDGTLTGVVTYLVLTFLKDITIPIAICVTAAKVTKLVVNRPKAPVNVIEVEDV